MSNSPNSGYLVKENPTVKIMNANLTVPSTVRDSED